MRIRCMLKKEGLERMEGGKERRNGERTEKDLVFLRQVADPKKADVNAIAACPPLEPLVLGR